MAYDQFLKKLKRMVRALISTQHWLDSNPQDQGFISILFEKDMMGHVHYNNVSLASDN